MDWKQFQDKVAIFFRGLGCMAEVEAKVTGARAQHKIDVWVRFDKFGLETKWVIECKYWNTPVTKEKVLALRSIVEDVGADRGIIISTSGFQAGAIKASRTTNITLTGFDELKDNAQEELIVSMIYQLETKAIEIKSSLQDLIISKRTGPNSWVYKSLPGANSKEIYPAIGKLSILEFAFQSAKVKKPPYIIMLENSKVTVDSLSELVEQAAKVINEAEITLKSQTAQIDSA